MLAKTLREAIIECRAPTGVIMALLRIWPENNVEDTLVSISEDDVQAYNEAPIQLRERARYFYELTALNSSVSPLRLRESRGIKCHPARHNEGALEPRDNVGRWRFIVVRSDDPLENPVGIGEVEVRSVKLEYREHYRGMLVYIAERAAGLLLDSRSPTQLHLDTLWQTNPRIIEQQLEFLRHTLESAAFRGALDEVLRNPHRRLEDEHEAQSVGRPFKPNRDFARQLQRGGERLPVPTDHPLRARMASIPAQITLRRHTDFFDTAENRFAKMVLVSFRDFLSDVLNYIAKSPSSEKPENAALIHDAARLRGMLETQLNRGFLPDISRPTFLPLGSPVLQNRSGYREMLRYWLQFHAGAQLAWEGGEEVYGAGARDVASLYEYWLFFQLEALFRGKFSVDKPLHKILVTTEDGLPHLNLKRGIELKTPVGGAWSATTGRTLHAEFHFNHKFSRNEDHTKQGSWTRGVQPDYTFSLWPAAYTREQAESNELMVHVHFDSKYRISRNVELWGNDGDEDLAQKYIMDAAKYEDLLKMHAYRDAIRRTAGAYVLYPGNPSDNKEPFKGYHEILPGLGAFAIRPRTDGTAEGLDTLSIFLDQVIEHLSNRTTTRERVSYHTQAAYQTKENPVPYGAIILPEKDMYGAEFRALPPAEHMVLCAWYESLPQLELSQQEYGFVIVRLGRRAGALHVHPDLAQTRHILLRTYHEQVASGLLTLREPGFRIYTRTQLRSELQVKAKQVGVTAWEAIAANDDDEFIYALFQTRPDYSWANVEWHGDELLNLIEAFEFDVRHRPVENVGRTSDYPRLLPLRDVIKARA